MWRLIVALALIGLPVAAHAEWKTVTRQQSKLLLEAPLLENGRKSIATAAGMRPADTNRPSPRSCPRRARIP